MKVRICSNMHRNLYNNILKITRNSCTIYPKLIQNLSKINKIRSLGRFGAFSAPFRAQVGSRTLPVLRGTRLLEPFLQKMALQGDSFGHPLDPRWLQNRTFEIRSALGPPQNGLWEGVRKKHENLMKNPWENGPPQTAKSSRNYWFL